MYCSECGHRNPEGARFCGRCGASLLEQDAGEPTQAFSAIEDDEDAARAADRDVMTIGRAPQSDVFLDDITVSREHARLERTPNGVVLTDQGSLNGTYVNRERIESTRLSDGDELQVGKYRLAYIERP
jgi:pSer/pThr/pTyr-binding forkhead associated (FHA) protein